MYKQNKSQWKHGFRYVDIETKCCSELDFQKVDIQGVSG